MYLELKQNEVCNIPRDREQITRDDGTIVPATTEQYFWLPIKRIKRGNQIIWVEDGADLGDLAYTECTYIDSDNVEQKMSYQSELNTQCLQYLNSTDWFVTRKYERNIEIPQEISSKRILCAEAIV